MVGDNPWANWNAPRSAAPPPNPAATGRGLFGQFDDPAMAARFVAGGGDPAQPGSGFGGQFGEVTRFGTLLDTRAVGALTSGREYLGGDPGGEGHDDLIGGDPDGVVPSPPPPSAAPAATSQAPQPTAGNVARRVATNPYTSQLLGRVLGGGLKKVPVIGWGIEALDATLADRGEVRDEAMNPTWMTLLSPGRAVRGAGILGGEASGMYRSGQEQGAAASGRRAADVQARVSDLEQAAGRRPLSPAEQTTLDQSRAELARLRAETQTGFFGGLLNRVTGTNPQQAFDQANRRMGAGLGTSMRLQGDRLRDGEQSAAAVLGGTATPQQTDSFNQWMDHVTGEHGRVRGQPAAPVVPAEVVRTRPQSEWADHAVPPAVGPEADQHRQAVASYLQRMSALAADATARGRTDVAARANTAIEATRREQAAWERAAREVSMRRTFGGAAPPPLQSQQFGGNPGPITFPGLTPQPGVLGGVATPGGFGQPGGVLNDLQFRRMTLPRGPEVGPPD
jgi:hypothetical protein